MPVVCKATPETTRVKNNRNRNITIKKVGSIYQPYSDEPFTISRRLGGGRSITFGAALEQTITCSPGDTFTAMTSVAGRGVRVITGSGTRFGNRCG